MAHTLQKKDTYLNELFFLSILKARKRIHSKTVDRLITYLNESVGDVKLFLSKKIRYSFIGEKPVQSTIGEFLECGVTGFRLAKIEQLTTNTI